MNNLFGTDGIRARVNTGLFVPHNLMQFGSALNLWIRHKYGPNAHILIAHDTRISSYFIKAALKAGLLHNPLTIHNANILPTPGLMHIMQENPQLSVALMISASHNPFHDNGIKIIDAKTGKLTTDDELFISDAFHTQQVPTDTSEQFGIDLPPMDAQSLYGKKIISLFNSPFLTGKTIVLDTAHGATSEVAPHIFAQLGAHVITINNSPNGYNINDQCGALHVEQLAAAVLHHKADAGFAFDGDGDRVIAINAHGEVKDGDDLLLLLSTHPRYAQSSTLVGTIMTNEGLLNHLKSQNKNCIRTAVGDKHVAEQLQTQQLLLGGEPSGHIILHDIISTGDGILVALTALETMIITHNTLMHTFTKYPQVMINIPITQRRDLTDAPFSHIITASKNNLTTGRISVRYSGTENVLRVMVETSDQTTATHTCQQLAATLSQALQ